MIKNFNRYEYKKTLDLIRNKKLNTVCISANCPNRYECFSNKTATFMVLGNICTRDCTYCNVVHGNPENVDPKEPSKIADAVVEMGIKHAVITMVTRDDLRDKGANHVAETISQIKKKTKNDCSVEALISDFGGEDSSLKKVIDAKPNVLNHNLEAVREVFNTIRPKADYDTSLNLLKKAKLIDKNIITKSGLMVGLGETKDQLIKCMKEINMVGCGCLTIGQYLQPSPNHTLIIKEYSDDEFDELKEIAYKIGFKAVESGRLVRSSYHAKEMFNK